MENQSDFIEFEDSDKSQIEEKKIISVNPLTVLPTNPWVPSNRKYSKNLITKLDQEIRDFYRYIQPSKGEHEMRLFTISRLESIVKIIYGDSRVLVFGSFETKLYLPSSDLDIVIMNKSLQKPQCLFTLERALSKYNISSKIDVISKSKVPIVKYVDNLTKFSLDVSFNVDNGVQALLQVMRAANDVHIGKPLKMLMLILKQFLVQRHLNEVFTGGIGSYSLLWMIYSFLKLHPRIQTGEIDPLDNIGILLIEFFELYSKHFNYERVGLGLKDTEPYFARRFEHRQSMLSIKDPQDQSNDVSSGSYRYEAVKWAFGRAFTTLTTIIGAGYEHQLKDPNLDSIPDTDETMLTVLGNIITINRDVLEQREYIQVQYEKYLNGQLKIDLFETVDDLPKMKPQKRKLDNVLYIEAQSDESIDLPRKKICQDLSSSESEGDLEQDLSTKVLPSDGGSRQRYIGTEEPKNSSSESDPDLQEYVRQKLSTANPHT